MLQTNHPIPESAVEIDRDGAKWHSLDPAWSYSSVTEEESICHWLGIVDLTNLLPLRKSLILSQPRSSLIKPSLKGSWPWSVARMPRQLGATLGPRSWASIARAFGGWCKTSTLQAKTTRHSCMPAWAWVMISS